MFRGFDLKLNWDYKKWLEEGSELYNENQRKIEKTLKSFKNADGSLNGSKLKANWFPEIKADIFISHSHRDRDMAIALAGLLWKTFNITAFVDSCIWGYANRLLKMVDDEFCQNKGQGTYSYEKRNDSTSHVYMMLSSALCTMIDRCECLFFLNTPQSITPNEVIQQTKSPWIFSEIAMTQLIRQKSPKEHRAEKTKVFTKAERDELNEQVNINYDLSLGHFTIMDLRDINAWIKTAGKDAATSLDALYTLKPTTNFGIL